MEAFYIFMLVMSVVGIDTSIRASRRYWPKIFKMSGRRMQRKIIWYLFVTYFSTLATLTAGFGIFMQSLYYDMVAVIVLGVSFILFATVPCGMEYFNRKRMRPFRNLAFLVVGGSLIALAVFMYILILQQA